MNSKQKTKLIEFIRYVLVGTLAAAIHYGIYYMLQVKIDVNVAYTTGYLISLACNFMLTTYFTFRTKPSTGKALGFGISHLINYVLHIGLFNLYLYVGISRELAPVLVLAVAVPLNFILLKYVFTSKRKFFTRKYTTSPK